MAGNSIVKTLLRGRRMDVNRVMKGEITVPHHFLQNCCSGIPYRARHGLCALYSSVGIVFNWSVMALSMFSNVPKMACSLIGMLFFRLFSKNSGLPFGVVV